MPASYGSTVTASITLTGLAAGGIAYSTAIDNTSALYDGLNIMLKAKTGDNISDTPRLIIGIAGSNDNSAFATFGEVESIIDNSDYLKLFPGTSRQHYVTLRNLPAYYKIYVKNRTGDALTNVGGDNTITYRGFVNT